MSEHALWVKLREAIKGLPIHMVRVENRVGTGTPDIAYATVVLSGWIELKSIPRWPRRDGPVEMGFEKEQLMWAEGWRSMGGATWLLLKVSRPIGYWLFDLRGMQVIRNGATRNVITSHSVWCCGSLFPRCAERLVWRLAHGSAVEYPKRLV